MTILTAFFRIRDATTRRSQSGNELDISKATFSPIGYRRLGIEGSGK